MIIDFSGFAESLSFAIDYAEAALTGATSNHGLRVAVLTRRMAAGLNLDEDALYMLTQAALLHDCAIMEYLSDEPAEAGAAADELDMCSHCRVGERMLLKLPFYENISGAVLYHHERADGQGAFCLKPEQTPFYAQLIHIADNVDVRFSLNDCDAEKYTEVCAYVRTGIGTLFTEECAEAFLNAVDRDLMQQLSGAGVRMLYHDLLPQRMIEVSMETLREMSSIFADITDYKSNFTWRHSMGIAEKAEAMGHFYALPEEECSKLYVAGALHDIGKLLTSNDILDKPGKLTPEEYKEIQNHAVGTWDLLHRIGGLEDIASWAALHHEKLDGSGYPFGYTGERLDRNSRLMACLDIYQALVEDRPYKAGMSHSAAMAILRKMGSGGQLDQVITDDIDACFGTKESAAGAPAREETAYTGSGPAWRCPVCGYIYEGELPGDFICPRCEQPGTIFEPVGSR